MQEILIKLPVSNQFEEGNDKEWAHRICAISSLWMLLKLHDPGFDLSVMDLVKRGLEKNGYLENIGWKHAVVAELANEFGLGLTYAKKFFYSPEEKEGGMEIINRNLRSKQPVVASIYHELNPAKAGHMVVVRGLQEFRNVIIGYHIQDSDGRWRGHNYFLTRQEFLNGWRGGLIYK